MLGTNTKEGRDTENVHVYVGDGGNDGFNLIMWPGKA